MLMPSIFGEDMFDDFFGDFPVFRYDDRDQRKLEKKLYGRRGKNLMKTDIKELENGYELEVDLGNPERGHYPASGRRACRGNDEGVPESD